MKRSGHRTVSFHGWMWSWGLGDLTRMNGNLDPVQYIQILKTFIPFLWETAIPIPKSIHFVHNSSSIYTSHDVTQWFQEHREIIVIDWPSISCDINIIENVWAIMVRT